MAATEQCLNLCLPTMTQARCKHATQCISLVHADVLRIARQRHVLCTSDYLLGTSCPEIPGPFLTLTETTFHKHLQQCWHLCSQHGLDMDNILAWTNGFHYYQEVIQGYRYHQLGSSPLGGCLFFLIHDGSVVKASVSGT